MKVKIALLIIVATIWISCESITNDSSSTSSTTANKIEDEKAAKIVDEMLLAMGGAEKWEKLNYVSWTFFGSRHLVWDKRNGRVRIESPRDTSVYLVDLNKLTGKFAQNDKEIVEPEVLAEKIKRGKDIWINDMYWLFMPFKLTDPGVSVKHARVDTTLAGALSDVLELSFDSVGNTPENKYQVYIDQKDGLIKQWDFFKDAKQDTASRQWPWDNYADYNGLLLSSNRSDDGGPSNVKVYDSLDDKVFTSFETFVFY